MQLEAISSCPVTCYLGEETHFHRATIHQLKVALPVHPSLSYSSPKRNNPDFSTQDRTHSSDDLLPVGSVNWGHLQQQIKSHHPLNKHRGNQRATPLFLQVSRGLWEKHCNLEAVLHNVWFLMHRTTAEHFLITQCNLLQSPGLESRVSCLKVHFKAALD